MRYDYLERMDDGAKVVDLLKCVNTYRSQCVPIGHAFSIAAECIECALLCVNNLGCKQRLQRGDRTLIALSYEAELPSFTANRYLLSALDAKFYDAEHWVGQVVEPTWDDYNYLADFAEECVMFAQRECAKAITSDNAKMEERYMQIFAANLRKYRNRAQMSQKDLARAVGFESKVSVTRIESAVAKVPYTKVCLMARLLGVTPNDLLGGDSEWRAASDGSVT